jgi:hypothetical protein
MSRRRNGKRAVWPDTQIACAYLTALTKWAQIHHQNLNAKITLPIGVVGVDELMNVLRALEKARQTTEA